jgi:uroporphyrinogen-III synthase
LTKRGFDCAVEPLLRIEPLDTPFPNADYEGVLFTSANAADTLADIPEVCAELAKLPCFCVGETTGEAARAAGFTNMHCGTSDSTELARLVTATLKDDTAFLLHVCGHPTDDKLQLSLSRAGFTLTAWPVYRTAACDEMPPTMYGLVRAGNVGCIPVFSPRSAQLLVALIENSQLVEACSAIGAVALSQAVADVLQRLPWRQLRIAKSPRADDVLACLEEISMTEPTKTSSTEIPVVPMQRKSRTRKIGWTVLTIVVLSGIGAVALTQCALFHDILLGAENAHVAQNIDVLEDRVRMLESAQKAEATTVVAPENNAAVSGLAENVRNLQAQVAQLQDARAHDKQNTQKDIAAAFAFWNLRSAVDDGRRYAAPLGALQSSFDDTLKNDPAVTESLTVLFTSATGVETYNQLHDEVAAHEPALDTVSDADISGWVTHISRIMHSLISIRPSHSPAFDNLENGLANSDGQSASTAFDSLPVEARTALSTWHEKLKARVAVDDAMRTLAAKLAIPTAASEATP